MPHSHSHWPYYYYVKHHRNMFWGPSRLVWFGLGSVATWAWIRHHHHHHQHRCEGTMWPPRAVDYRGRPSSWEREAAADGGAGGERRQMPPAMPTSMSREDSEWRRPMRQGQGTGTAPVPVPSTGVPPGPQLQSPPPPPVDHHQDFERLREMGRNAEETVSFFEFLLGPGTTCLGDPRESVPSPARSLIIFFCHG